MEASGLPAAPGLQWAKNGMDRRKFTCTAEISWLSGFWLHVAQVQANNHRQETYVR
jgi:hypothetical protein